jgi:exoribonuclease-2
MFPMLPEELSTDRTSLAEGQRRLVIVIELLVTSDGTVTHHDCYRAWVKNQAKLDYPSVGAWLDGQADPPAKVAASAPLADQLRLQNRIAAAMRTKRHQAGALDLETIEATPVATDGKVTELAVHHANPATRLIEDFMIGANVAMAGFLEESNLASIRRVVKAPERWSRIVALAGALGEHLPAEPDAKALSQFLARRRTADPVRFPDLSLSVVKLMGPGEYAVERPGQTSDGHFGLAVQDYTHSTAPNRRFADLVTQRLLKTVLAGTPPAYSATELDAIAVRCTTMEDAARKVERTCRKLAAAVLLSGRIGQQFDGIVTGKNPKGTFVRTLHPPAEGMVVRGQEGMDVGDRVTLTLLAVDPTRGFIDFGRA